MNSVPLPVDDDVREETFHAVRVKQPIGDIYLGSISFDLIQRITYFDVRRILREKRDVERYLGIQRPLNEKRVEELKKYVNFIDATFPTSIIIAVGSDYARYDENSFLMTLSNKRTEEDVPSIAFRSLCRVIDGQHRIAGLEGFRGKNFEVPVSVFVGSDIADQAYVFATVNLEQTKVNKSLALDLYELARTRSPHKTCHNITVALDIKEGSPFFQRIKRLGVATTGRTNETLSQSTVVDGIMKYISKDPKSDRDKMLRGEKLNKVDGVEAEKFCFRNMFIEENDVQIGKILEQYFLAVQARWPNAWNRRDTGLILNRTNGYRALIGIFGEIYLSLSSPGNFVTQDEFLKKFKKVDATDDFFSTENFKPGSSGASELRRFLLSKML